MITIKERKKTLMLSYLLLVTRPLVVRDSTAVLQGPLHNVWKLILNQTNLKKVPETDLAWPDFLYASPINQRNAS